MKFALFALLALCAVVAHAQFEYEEYEFEAIEPQNKITEELRKKIEELVKKATDAFADVSEKISAIMGKLREHLRDIVMKVKEKVDQAREEVEKKLDELKKRGGAFAECAKKLEPEYRQVHKETMAGLKQCAGDAMVANEEHKREVAKAQGIIRENVRQLRDMVADCLGWNPIKSAKCIFEQTSELKKIVGNIVSQSTTVLRLTRARANEIRTKAKECNHKIIAASAEKVKALNQKLADCYKGAQYDFEFY